MLPCEWSGVGVKAPAQSGTTDQSVDLGVCGGGVGVVDGELDAFFEHHPQRQRQRLVLGVEGVDQGGQAHLAGFALGLDVDAAHRAPPA